jgi:hypothetical protein
MVTVRIPAALRKYATDRDPNDVDGRTVAEVIAAVCSAHPDLRERLIDVSGRIHPYLSVFVGDLRVGPHDTANVEVAADGVVTVLVSIAGGADDDVRMVGFRERVPVEEALLAALSGAVPLPSEELPVAEAAGRVASAAVVSTVDIPSFRRSTMDGYAVVAEDTFGATAYSPIPIEIVGVSMPGSASVPEVTAGSAVRIMTGAPLPPVPMPCCEQRTPMRKAVWSWRGHRSRSAAMWAGSARMSSLVRKWCN